MDADAKFGLFMVLFLLGTLGWALFSDWLEDRR